MTKDKYSYVVYELSFLREFGKSFQFEIPETKNKVFIPKSQCKVETETFELEKGKIYNVHVVTWLAEEKQLNNGGIEEEKIIVKVNVKVLDLREKAMKIKYLDRDLDFWIPVSQVMNKEEIPKEGDNFKIMMHDWLFNKKIKEAEEDKTVNGRMLVGDKNVDGHKVDEDDLPF